MNIEDLEVGCKYNNKTNNFVHELLMIGNESVFARDILDNREVSFSIPYFLHKFEKQEFKPQKGETWNNYVYSVKIEHLIEDKYVVYRVLSSVNNIGKCFLDEIFVRNIEDFLQDKGYKKVE